MRRSPEVNVMVRAAQRAARGLVRDFGEVENLQVSEKGPGEFVSVADRQAERSIFEELEKARPRFGFLMEESGVHEGSDTSNRWVVDPLDGTDNFLHGIPHFCVSISLERDGEPIAGVVHNPITDDTYWAERGIGAYGNHSRLRVSARRRPERCLLASGSAERDERGGARYLGQMKAVLARGARVRRFGAAALDLAYVAAGRCDGFWECGLRRWDVSAGILLVREAGGMVSDLFGQGRAIDTGNILATNGGLHDPLLGLLASAG